MMSERPHLILVAPSDDDHRVVRIRLRRAKTDGMARWREPIHDSDPNISTVLSLAKERDRQKDDYQHRMIMDGLALDFTAALMAAGIWPAVNNIHGFSLHPRPSGQP